MKRCLSLVLLLCWLFSLSAGALTLDKYNFNISLGNDYSVLTEDNLSRQTEFIESLGHSKASVEQYFKENSLILFAATETRQAQVTCTETEFSKRLGDLALLEDKEALNMVNRFVKVQTVANLNLVSTNGMKFYEVISLNSDKGGSYSSVQYITIKGGKLYSISFFENASQVTDDFKNHAFNAIKTVSIGAAQNSALSGAGNIAEMVIVGIMLLLALALAIALLLSLTRDFMKYDDTRHFIVRRRKK